jgi:hypothetical protein
MLLRLNRYLHTNVHLPKRIIVKRSGRSQICNLDVKPRGEKEPDNPVTFSEDKNLCQCRRQTLIFTQGFISNYIKEEICGA